MARRKRKPLYGDVTGATGGLPGQAPATLYGGTQEGTVTQAGAGLPAAATAGKPLAPATKTAPQPDPMLLAQQAAANLNIGLGDTYDAYKTGRLNTQYGNLDDPASDAVTNPYSLAAKLQTDYENAKRGSLNSYASQGQLYSGALQNRTEDDRRGYDSGLNNLKQGKQDALDQIAAGKITRYGQTGAQLSADQLASLLKMIGG